MPAPKTANATTVSRALAESGVTKSEKYKVRIGYRRTRGFIAENEIEWDHDAHKKARTGRVFVRWVSGNFARLPGDEEREHANLTKAAEILTEKGYTVETNVSSGGYMTLTVTRPA